ncbi:7-carboxy-7-deazaguanine synthase [Sphingosinicella rhizophila]|uniref:7-carboxy-7-deazaguanine synthase n=1 Tax=Sphingosinicella rhizophila TaxID=3050082 RepID=A0ABU3Q955_9SPHN|nr:7-carboxy-7-deazaguanine synthase [Sphingosinicella sp. GR2756]MDT9599847.1 7-carboxy-7-deazaguanine synthase [Sphingosinicella sp. GR2756]
MSYSVKEMFVTLQGEGAQAGRRALFVRFSGCNLWTGRERHRATADCRFCDTDFVGTDGLNGGRYDCAELVANMVGLWGEGESRFAVMTGGEPLLQIDAPLLKAVRDAGFEIAVETNGTIAAPDGIDWICVSPKAGTRIVQRSGNELKLVWPQNGIDPDGLLDWRFDHFLIQPMDCVEGDAARAAAIDFVMANPRWRLSLQTHKLLGLP